MSDQDRVNIEEGLYSGSLKHFFKDLTKYLPSFFVPAALSIISLPVFTHYLPPDQWATYILVLNTIDLLVVLMISWAVSSIIRFYEQNKQEGTLVRLLSSVIGYSFLSLALFVLAIEGTYLITGTRLISAELMPLVWLGIWVLVSRVFGDVVGTIFRANRQVGRYSTLIALQNILRYGLAYLFVAHFESGVPGILTGHALGLTIAFLPLGLPMIIRYFRPRSFSWDVVKKLFLFGGPIVAGDIAAWLLRLSDRYILLSYREEFEVGIYSVGFDLSDKTLMLIISILALTSSPLAVQVWENGGKTAIAGFLTKLARVYSIVVIPAVFGMIALRVPLTHIMTQEAYHDASRVIPFIVLSTFLYGLLRWFQIILSLYQKTIYVMLSVFGGGLVNIVLNLFLVPKYGYMAAAVTNLVGYGVFAALTIAFSRKYLAWDFPFRTVLKSLLAASIMLLPVLLIQRSGLGDLQQLLAGIGAGGALYFLCLYLLREFDKREISSLTQILIRRAQ